jgi:hypothetical protein
MIPSGNLANLAFEPTGRRWIRRLCLGSAPKFNITDPTVNVIPSRLWHSIRGKIL